MATAGGRGGALAAYANHRSLHGRPVVDDGLLANQAAASNDGFRADVGARRDELLDEPPRTSCMHGMPPSVFPGLHSSARAARDVRNLRPAGPLEAFRAASRVSVGQPTCIVHAGELAADIHQALQRVHSPAQRAGRRKVDAAEERRCQRVALGLPTGRRARSTSSRVRAQIAEIARSRLVPDCGTLR